jgi:hypothetical protein
VCALSMCGKAFGIKTELTTVPTRSDIGEAAADAEGVRSLAVVAAVQMLDITGCDHIGELVATVRGRTLLETGPGGWEWWWRGGAGRRTTRRQWSWGRSVRVNIIRGGGVNIRSDRRAG